MPALAIDGAEIDFEVTGHGRPIVLVHGGMCDRADWDRLVPLLPADAAVVRLDLRAHGRSGGCGADVTIARLAADVNALVGHLGLGAPVLVGHSLGARVVCEAAVRAPVAGVVLLDGSRSHGGLAATELAPGGLPPMQRGLAEVLALTIGPVLDEPARARVLATMLAAPSDVMAACVAALRDWDTEWADAVYPALGCPVMAIQSTYHDAFTPRRSFDCRDGPSPFLDFLRRSVPDLNVEVLVNAGHFIQLEQPGRVAALVAEFAAGLP